ncbi:hypothetical protein Noda2021_01690 [Candidatus Dependentiae bacterium Noda2021]|nr:hypothetical protein Noda2021_01690 [Candidatus Dependentiae bacterium Noda2021]
MKLKIILMTYAMVQGVTMCYAAEVKPIHESQYSTQLPLELKTLLDANIHTLEPSKASLFDASMYKPAWLPGWIVKSSNVCFTRLSGATKFVQAKEKLQLDSIEIPVKYGYTSARGNHYVIAQLIHDTKKDLTLSDTKRVYKIACEVGWKDAHRDNFFKTERGTVAIIDTEAEYLEKTKSKNIKEAVVSKMLCKHGYTSEAYNYLIQKNLKLIEMDISQA